jgi:hypothetical protein
MVIKFSYRHSSYKVEICSREELDSGLVSVHRKYFDLAGLNEHS